MFKKISSMMMCMVLASSLIMGCGSKAETVSDEVGVTKSDTEETAKKDKIKIGVSIWNTTTPLGISVQRMLDYAAESLDCEIEYVATALETDAVVSSVENLVSSGCDGIIVCNSADGQMPKLIKTCENNQVYLAQMFRTIGDPEVEALLEKSDYFVGRTYENEVDTGYRLGKILTDEKGCKNVGIISLNRGDLTAENRYKGYKKAFDEKGVTIVAEQWEVKTSEDGAAAANNFMAAYPEMDGFVVIGGPEQMTGAMNAIESNGKTDQIAVVGTDFNSTMKDDLEKGRLSAIAGGHWSDALFSMLLVYNAANGDLDASQFPIEVKNPMINVNSSESYQEFVDWFEGEQLPFNAEEIRNMTKKYNDNFSADMIIEAADKLTIEDVKERHSK